MGPKALLGLGLGLAKGRQSLCQPAQLSVKLRHFCDCALLATLQSSPVAVLKINIGGKDRLLPEPEGRRIPICKGKTLST